MSDNRRDKTYTLLVEHLLTKPQSELRDKTIVLAKDGAYSDFGSQAALPKTELYYRLMNLEFPDLATNVAQGVYD